MATVKELVDRLKKDAQIEDSEKAFLENGDAMLTQIIEEAITEHNPLYTIVNLPAAQQRLVVYLGWIEVCTVRASNHVNESNLSGTGGYGQDRNSPYQKNMDMAAKLRVRYDALCAKLGINSSPQAAPLVHVSSSRIQSDVLNGATVPLSKATIPIMVLSLIERGADFVKLGWTVSDDNFKNFTSFKLAGLQGTIAIFQDWNFNSASGVPKINDDAYFLEPFITDPRTRSLKVEGVTFLQKNRYLLVMGVLGDYHGYSNELVIDP